MIPVLRLALTLGLSTLALAAGTPLSKAAIGGDLVAAKACVANGEKLDELDKWGWTPLMWACFYRNDLMVRWLLSIGANPNVVSMDSFRKIPAGTTALAIASLYGNDDQVRELLLHRADPSIKNAKGRLAMDYAKENENMDIVAFLEGRTALTPAVAASAARFRLAAADRILILCPQGDPNWTPFLQSLLDTLVQEFANRNIHSKGLLQDTMALDRDQEILAAVAEFKAGYILTLAPLQSEALARNPSWVITATFLASLSRPGSRTLLFEHDVTARDSGRARFLGIKQDTAARFVLNLMTEMELQAVL